MPSENDKFKRRIILAYVIGSIVWITVAIVRFAITGEGDLFQQLWGAVAPVFAGYIGYKIPRE